MNFTFRLVPDFGDVRWSWFGWSVIGLAAVFVVGWLFLGWRAVRALETLVRNVRRPEVQPAAWLSGPTQGSPAPERKEPQTHRVPERTPESIAPNLRRPPKAAGFSSSEPSDPA